MARTDRKIAANMIAVAASKGVSAVSGLAIIALLTRYLGPDGFGEYRTVVAFTSFAYFVSDLGLYSYTLRAISEPGADKLRLINMGLRLRLLLALVFLSAATLLGLAMPFSSTVQIGIALAILGYFCHSGSDLLLAAFQNELRQYQFATTEVIGGLAALLLSYLIVVNNLGVLGAVAALVGGFVATFASNLVLLRHSLSWKIAFDWHLARGMLVGSMPLAGALIFGLIYSRMDIVFLSVLKSPTDVGIYGITHKVADVTMALPYFFAGLVMPALTAAAVSNKEKFASILSKSYMAMCVGGVGMALLIVLFADVFIDLLAGSDYVAGARALQIMGVKIGLFFVANLLIFTTTALSMQRRMLKGHAITAAVSIVAYVILIPWLSYDGAALATTIAEIVILLFAFFLITEHSGRILSFSIPIKCVLAGVVSYGLITQTVVSDTHWFVQFILVGLFYLILIVIFRPGAWSAFRDIARR